MTKRIFAIIGIVCGSVAVFCGAVFGVMALMGKFKTPVVYPTELSFEFSEMTVIEGTPFDTSKTLSEQDKIPTRYEFKLVGLNPDYEVNVNQTECYIWFTNTESSKLITLCDVNLNPLKSMNNRYIVHCNQPIYFMVNKIAGDGIIDGDKTDGVAILEARSTNDTLKKPDKPLNIYIDREVEAVYVNYGTVGNSPNIGNGNYNTQNLTIGTNMDLAFDYKVITELSHRPIHALNAKEIELYLNATGIANDYIRVTEEEINKPNSPLYNVMRYENNKFILNDAQASNYQFIVAVFPTYEAKANYEASIEGQMIESPNVHRTNAMLKTKLSVEVQEISISNLTFKRNVEATIHLYLYDENDYINLDGADNLIENKKNNSLGAQLWVDNGLVEETTRLDSFKFADYSSDSIWYGGSYDIVFKNSSSQHVFNYDDYVVENDEIKVEDTQESTGLKIELSNVKLSETLTVIKSIYKDEVEGVTAFYSARSWAVLDQENNKIRLLRPGNYLNFYVLAEDGETFTVATSEQFSFIANDVDGLYGKNKSWQVIAQSEANLAEGETLTIGAFVVNGTFTNSSANNIDNFFRYVNVQVDTYDLEYEALALSNTLNVTFEATQAPDNTEPSEDPETPETPDDLGIVYGEKSFEEIINITGGSYTAGVLLTTDNEKVETLQLVKKSDGGEDLYNVVYVGDVTYYIVGYVDENNKFNNSVKLKGSWTKQDKLDLKMLLLHNEYGQTAEQFIEKLQIPNEPVDIKIENAEIVSNLTIDVKANYVLNSSLVSTKVWAKNAEEGYVELAKTGGVYEFYENTSGHIIEVISDNAQMFNQISAFYGNNPEISFDVADGVEAALSNVTAEGFTEGSWRFELTINALGNDDLFRGTINCGGEYVLPALKVLSGRPSAIVFNTENNQITLASSPISVSNSNTYIEIKVGYDGTQYTHTFILVKDGIAEEQELDVAKIFNEKITSPQETGFQSKEDKQQSYSITYSTLNGVFALTEDRNVVINKLGEEILEVNISGVYGYLKFKVIGNNLTLEPSGNSISKTTEDQTINLNALGVQIKYANEEYITSSYENAVFITNVTSIGYHVAYDADTKAYTVYQDSNSNDILDADEALLTISNDSANGWSFNRIKTYINIKVNFTVSTIIRDVDCEVIFSQAVSVAVNDAWADRNFYQGTTVALRNTSGSAVFNVKDNTGGMFAYSINGDETKFPLENDTSYLASTLGALAIKIYYNNVEIMNFTFSVLPNVVASAKDVKLITDKTYDLANLFYLKSYPTAEIYGTENLKHYTNASLEELSDESKLSIKADENMPTLTWGNGQLSVGNMESLNGSKKEITLQYTDAETIDILKHTFAVEHKYVATVENFEENADNYYLYKVNKEYNPLKVWQEVDKIEVEGYSLSAVTHYEADLSEFIVQNGTFKYANHITENRTLNVIFTLTNEGGDILTYKTDITLIPYTPDLRAVLAQAYSGSSYDLINDFYDVSSFNQIISLKATRFLNKNGNDITSNIVDGFVPNGYTAGVANPQCEVTFNDFAGDKIEIEVEFVIFYTSTTSYVYTVPLTILNRQSLIIQYPETNLGGENINFIFDNTSDIINLSGSGLGNLASVKVKDFEPILVYTNAKVEIDLSAKDADKNVIRAAVDNRIGTYEKNLKIEVVAYESSANGAALNRTKISVYNSVLKIAALGASQNDFAAYYILKLSTDSLNFNYYFIRLYCTNLAVSTSNNLDVVAYQNEEYPAKDTDLIKVDSTQTLEGLIAATQTVLENTSQTIFENTFNKVYNSATTSLWLYNGYELGGEYENVDGATSQWSKLDLNSQISSLLQNEDKYTTLTVGLMYQNMNQQYIYGTITIYVQPNIEVTSDSGLKFNKPNGEFVADLANNSTNIPNLLNGFRHDASEIYINGTLLSEIEEGNVNYDLLSVDEAMITIDKRVASDTLIRVKYSNGNTVAFITYIYKATELPAEETIATEVGKYDEDSSRFINTVVLEDATIYTEKYFNSYIGNYRVFVGSSCLYDSTGETTVATVEGVRFDQGKLIFTQTTQQWEINIRIEYVDYANANNSRTFRFVVLAGVDVGAVEGVVGGDGSSMSAPFTTKIVGSDIDYNSAEPSQIEISKSQTENVTIFEIAGFNIRVNDINASMKIYFDDTTYYSSGLGDNGAVEFNAEGNAAVKFAHSAESKIITAEVEILNSEDVKFINKKIYIKILQTYGGIKVNYLTEYSTHENVVYGYYGNLTDKFIKGTEESDAQIELLDISGNVLAGEYDLMAMGFATDNNPNKIEFTRGTNMDITENNLTFYSVDTNKMTRIYLNNNAGIIENSVVYNFQIMAGSKVDGLDFTGENTSGRYETDYMSFMMGDTEQANNYSETFKLGKMIDEQNIAAFSLSNAYIGGVETSNITKIKFDDGEAFVFGTNTATNLAFKAAEFGDTFDGIQYRFYYNETSKYIFFITLHSNTNQVYLSVQHSEDGDIASQTLQFSLGGVNGNKTIVDAFKVYLSAEKVELKETVPASVYSYETIDLNDVFNMSSSEITFEVASGGKYYIGAEEKLLNASNDNLLFSLNGQIMTFKAVGQDTPANIVLNAKCGDYIIGTFTYNLEVKCNFTIIANGESWSESRNKDSLSTNFALTGTNFANGIKIYFISQQQMNNMANDDIQKGDGRYFVLAYDAYRLHTNNGVGKNNVIIRSVGGNGWSLYGTPGNYHLSFTKDYNSTVDGDIVLTLEIDTDIGIYSKEWTINVAPIVSLVAKNKENYKISSGVQAFKSNMSVNLVSTGGDSTGVIINSDNKVELNISAQYSISIANTTTMNVPNKGLFNLETADPNYVLGPTTISNVSFNAEFNHASVILPNVPASLNAGQSYYVTYRFVVTYLDLSDGTDENATARVFYITYMVANEQKVETYTNSSGKSSSNIDVTQLSGSVLNLFKFEQNNLSLFKTNSETKPYNVKYGTSNYVPENDNGTKKYFSNGQYFDVNTNKMYEDTGEELGVDVSVKTVDADNDKLLFKTSFANIFEYCDFVNSLTKARITNAQDNSTYDFDINYNSNTFSIDLASNGVLFNNKLLAEFALMSGDTKIVTIAAYNENDGNSRGFRLYAGTNTITAKSSYKLSDIVPANLVTINNAAMNTNVEIVGVGAPQPNWTNGAENVNTTADATEYATFESGGNTYHVKRAKFSSTSGVFYTTDTYYYYISEGPVYVVDYLNNSTALDYFRVAFPSAIEGTADEDNYAQFNLDNCVSKWANNDGVLERTSVSVTNVDGNGLPNEVTISGTTIKISRADLITYKQDNPNETYLTANVTLMAAGKPFSAIVKFRLPDTV